MYFPYLGAILKMQFKKDVASGSGRPAEAFAWITEVEEATSMESLSNDGVEFDLS